MALSISIRADATQFSRTIAGVRVEMSGLSGGIANVASGALGLAASLAKVGIGIGVVGAAMAVAFIKSASESASKIESLTMQFETLLGSTEAAQERMEEIKKFAASTPFEVANLSETSKLLQTLGGDMLATGAGLRLVGDAASIAGQPIQEVGLHIGRLFNAITSGTSAGESIARLQELGLISGKVKLEFESLAAAQKKGAVATLTSNEALKKLQEVLSKTDGAMERLSRTTEGKLSNMGEAINNLKVSFGTGFNKGLVELLDAGGGGLAGLEAGMTKAGKALGMAIKSAVRGDYDMFQQIGVVIGEAMIAGIKATVDVGLSLLLREGIGGYISAGGRQTGNQGVVRVGQAVNLISKGLFGKGMSVEDSLNEHGGGFRRESEKLNNMVGLRGASDVVPTNYHETMRDEAIKQSGYLQLLAKDPFRDFMGQLTFER